MKSVPDDYICYTPHGYRAQRIRSVIEIVLWVVVFVAACFLVYSNYSLRKRLHRLVAATGNRAGGGGGGEAADAGGA